MLITMLKSHLKYPFIKSLINWSFGQISLMPAHAVAGEDPTVMCTEECFSYHLKTLKDKTYGED